MTTNTPPSSPPHESSKSKSSSKKLKKSASSSSVESVSNSNGRMIRFAGFEGENILSRPLLVDDDNLIPLDNIKNTFMTLKRGGSERKANHLIMEGSTDRLDLVASNADSSKSIDWPFKYAVAIVPSDSSEPIRVWDSEVLVSERRVKRLRAIEDSDAIRLGFSQSPVSSDSPTSAASAAIDYKTAQNLLGEAFGTRKRKQAIVSLEKNKVRPDSLGQPATSFISQTLNESAINAEIRKEEDPVSVDFASSLLPPYDKETSDVASIYSIEGLIPQECYKALPVKDFIGLSVKSSQEEIAAVQSQYCIKEYWMNRILAATRSDSYHTLRLLLFGHFLSSFRELKEAAINGPDGSLAAVQERLPGCPETVAQDLLARFADCVSSAATATQGASFLGKSKHKLPSMSRDKAIIYVLVCLLHLDGFRVNATTAANLFAITPTKLLTFFKALGCIIDRPGSGEEVNICINNRSVAVKYARLTAPLKFPLPPKRQGKK